MAGDRSLVYISCHANLKGAARKSRDAILKHLVPAYRKYADFEVWTRSQIPPSCNPQDEIKAAIDRSRIALLLLCPDYLASEQWQEEAEPLIAAHAAGEIYLIWQQLSACDCFDDNLNQLQPVDPGVALTQLKRSADREALELRISRCVIETWVDRDPLKRALRDLVVSPSTADQTVVTPPRLECDAVVLVLLNTGLEGAETDRNQHSGCSYQWLVLLQKTGDRQFQVISNGELQADPAYAREDLPRLMGKLQYWIDTNDLTGDSLLYIFAPDELLASEDWGGMGAAENGTSKPTPLIDCQPFLLGSLSRVLNPLWAKRRRRVMERMHRHLCEGTGAWLPEESLKDHRLLKKLDGQTPNPYAGEAVISAIYAPPSANLNPDVKWLQSVSESMIPLVVWKSSPRGSGEGETTCFGDEQMEQCLRRMPLIREDPALGHKAGRPHCPDPARLANARHQWVHPGDDMHGFTILVDHPDLLTLGDHLTQLTPAPLIST